MSGELVEGLDGSLTWHGITVGGFAVDLETGEEYALADDDEVVVAGQTYSIAYLKDALRALSESGEPAPELVWLDYGTTPYGMEGSSTLINFFQDFVERYSPEDQGESSEESLSDGLTRGDVQTIALLYEASFDRDGAIDTEGLNFWVDAREGGLSEVDVARYFLESDEFTQKNGDHETLSNTAFVEQLYSNVLERAPDADGAAFWAGVLDNGYDRAEALLDFALSQENVAASGHIDALVETTEGEWSFII